MNEFRINEFLFDTDSLLNILQKEELPNDEKINLYFLGQPQQNLLKIVFEAFSIIPTNQMDYFFVKGCECDVLYGENTKLLQVESSGKKEVDFAQMAELLSKFNNSKSNLKFECITNSDNAKKFNIHIIISDNDYLDVEWSNVLKDADFIFFTLTATALLSMCERKILRSTLLPQMENDLGILLTNNNMVFSEDKELINTSLAKLFGNYSTPIFKFPEENEENFANYLSYMLNNIDVLHERRKARIKRITLNELLKEIDMKIEILSIDNAQLDDAIELLNEKLQKLPDRKKSAFRRARMKYTSKLKIELAEAVSFFHHQFEETLKKEIEENNNLDELQNILPGYISSQWENEIALLNSRVQDFTEYVSAQIKDYINDDITSFIKDGISDDFASYVFGLTKMYMQMKPDNIEPSMQVQNFDFESTEKSYKIKKYGAVASGIVASGIALTLASNPIIGVAVAVLGSAQVIKNNKKNFESSSKQELLEASKKMCIDFHSEIDLWIEQAINNIENHLEGCINECYQNVINLMLEAINNKQTDFSNHDDEINQLVETKTKIQNELK
ncbi:MAG: hypothetical protein ACI37Z_08180 [Candidatus Gastranaerophilaceae bacterium]